MTGGKSTAKSGQSTNRSVPECPVCEDTANVSESPEAGYWTCMECGERGSGTEEPIWWRNDSASIWFVEQEAHAGP